MAKSSEIIGGALVIGGFISGAAVVGDARSDDAPAMCINADYNVAHYDKCNDDPSLAGGLIVLGALGSIAAGATLLVRSGDKSPGDSQDDWTFNP